MLSAASVRLPDISCIVSAVCLRLHVVSIMHLVSFMLSAAHCSARCLLHVVCCISSAARWQPCVAFVRLPLAPIAAYIALRRATHFAVGQSGASCIALCLAAAYCMSSGSQCSTGSTSRPVAFGVALWRCRRCSCTAHVPWCTFTLQRCCTFHAADAGVCILLAGGQTDG